MHADDDACTRRVAPAAPGAAAAAAYVSSIALMTPIIAGMVAMLLTAVRHFGTAALPYPRAAVAVTAMRPRAGGSGDSELEFLLVQRAKPPRAGSWSIPGGKVALGETSLEAAARELAEETGLKPPAVRMHPWAIGASDVIVHEEEGKADGKLAFHYVISQFACFATREAHAICGDDASGVRWVSLAEVEGGSMELGGNIAPVLRRLQFLRSIGALPEAEGLDDPRAEYLVER